MKRVFVNLVAVMTVTAGIFAQTNPPKFVISADRMNVLYAGIENPVSIAISSFPSEKITASIDNGTITHSGDYWVVTPSSPGRARITTTATAIDGKIISGVLDFRVKEIPMPIPQVAGKAGGNIDKNDFANARGILAFLEDFPFDLVYRVESFTVTVSTSQGERSLTSNSAAFTTEQKTLFQSLEPGQRVIISNITAVSTVKICTVSGTCTSSTKGPDGTQYLSNIVFTIK